MKQPITKSEFYEKFGYAPAGDSIGVVLMGIDGCVVTDYVFIPEPEVEELERLYSL